MPQGALQDLRRPGRISSMKDQCRNTAVKTWVDHCRASSQAKRVDKGTVGGAQQVGNCFCGVINESDDRQLASIEDFMYRLAWKLGHKNGLGSDAEVDGV